MCTLHERLEPHATKLLLFFRRIIHITNMDSRLVPDMLNMVHISDMAGHDLHVLIFDKINSGRALCGGASSWTSTKILPRPPSENLLVYGPSIMTSTVLPPQRKAPHTIMYGATLPSVCFAQASIFLSPSRLRTRIGPWLRYSLKRDSSKKTQCLQWRWSQSWCRRAHCRLRRQCSLLV